MSQIDAFGDHASVTLVFPDISFGHDPRFLLPTIGSAPPRRIVSIPQTGSYGANGTPGVVCQRLSQQVSRAKMAGPPIRVWLSSRVLIGSILLWSVATAQQAPADWQEELRKRVQIHDWDAARQIVDRQIELAPSDMDLRAWRARILTWSGAFSDAENEYLQILRAAPNDPDHWAGLSAVYSRQARLEDALRAIERAVQLDPMRADLRAVHARALRALHHNSEAKLEFHKALELDPTSSEAHAGLASLRGELRHELRVGMENDLFNFVGANQDGVVSLTSQWTPHWRTAIEVDGYQRAGLDAEKFTGSVTAKSASWGALTVGGAKSHDNGVVPRTEVFFDFDHGWRLAETRPLRALEFDYAQHWYWYTTARILALSGTSLLYLPREFTWSFALTGARSNFAGLGAEWRPSGMAKFGFPIATWSTRRLSGNTFFAAGTENFAQVDQIGRFSSKTYGGGLRLLLTPSQDLTSYAAYQRRTQGRTETSFGFTYGIHF